MTYRDRLQGMFECGALGDAFGAPFEFRHSKNPLLFNGTFEYPVTQFTRFQGLRTGVIGQVTDDTEKTLTLAASLIRNGGYNEEDVILSYEKWANQAHFLGKNTRALFKGVKTVKGYQARVNKIDLTNVQSNGSLMSCSSLAVLNLENYSDVISECQLTNPTTVNTECNVWYVYTLRYLLLGFSPETVYTTLRENVHEPGDENIHIRTLLEDLETLGPNPDEPVTSYRDIKTNKGWVLHGMWCALFALKYWAFYSKRDNPVKELLIKIIHFGGDTDTNGAIAGSLIGAIVGHDRLVELCPNEMRILYECPTTDGDFGLPPRHGLDNCHHPRDIPFLVDGLLGL